MVQDSLIFVDSPADPHNELYQDFVLSILQMLEPKQYFRRVLQEERQSVEEILFLMEGELQVGYDHNALLVDHKLVARKDLVHNAMIGA
mmetsp:Transcript_25178/g.39006  ORF Transcript_25178/g.39006 Transcript_25178/m.39006 type:complete len:89 (+) Transcript_25178:2200-2466(+)